MQSAYSTQHYLLAHFPPNIQTLFTGTLPTRVNPSVVGLTTPHPPWVGESVWGLRWAPSLAANVSLAQPADTNLERPVHAAADTHAACGQPDYNSSKRLRKPCLCLCSFLPFVRHPNFPSYSNFPWAGTGQNLFPGILFPLSLCPCYLFLYLSPLGTWGEMWPFWLQL